MFEELRAYTCSTFFMDVRIVAAKKCCRLTTQSKCDDIVCARETHFSLLSDSNADAIGNQLVG